MVVRLSAPKITPSLNLMAMLQRSESIDVRKIH